ncbi:MAG: glucose-1-phosphate adenylyltransferase [Anaerolineales bacterium]|nr:glucose-1-phosphate adenylyltransferase [Anaerolineales bacterium]
MQAIQNVLGVIMGGGRGTRLYPLTKLRAKPAVPIAGQYRLIDIPISNCINSGIQRIAVLSQFNTVSLHRHITQTYNFDSFHRGWVHIWAAEQTPYSDAWYQGTADAVRKQLFQIQSTGAEDVIILAGDHLYRMDYAKMAAYHWEKDADITVAVQPVSIEDASRFGLLKRDKNGTILDFVEKPKDPLILSQFISRDDPEYPLLGSMGIYFFKIKVLIDALTNSSDDDFGGEVIPKAIHKFNVYGYDFDAYWEDIGTIRSFYDTNLKLASENPPFNFYDPNDPIYTRPRFLPGSVVNGASLENVLLADGCLIGRAKIDNSVIGLRSQIQDGVVIQDSVLMGADYYHYSGNLPTSRIPLGIGENAHIKGAILDKNVRVGNDVIIRPFPLGTEIDNDDWVVRDGIVVIPKSTTIPPGTVIAPT